jgi:hypothetical protein
LTAGTFNVLRRAQILSSCELVLPQHYARVQPLALAIELLTKFDWKYPNAA